MRKKANMNIYLDQQQSVLSKTAKAKAFTSKEQICPSADWREWAKCRERGNIEELYFFGIFWYFSNIFLKKVLASHWALNMNPRNKLPLFPTRLLWGTSLEAFVGWNWGLRREGEVGILEQFGSSRAKVMSAQIFFCTKWSKREKGWYDSAKVK